MTVGTIRHVSFSQNDLPILATKANRKPSSLAGEQSISIASTCQVVYFSRSGLRCQNTPCHFPFNVFGSFGHDFAGCSGACRTCGFAPALAKGSILGHLFGFSTGQRGSWKVYAILTAFRIFYRI